MQKNTGLLLILSISFVAVWVLSPPCAASDWAAMADKAEELLLNEQYDEALKAAGNALEDAKKNDGPGQLDVANSLNILANIHERMGNYSEAIICLEQALAIREKVLRPDHTVIVDNLDSLAYLYTDSQKHSSAEPIYERLLAVTEHAVSEQIYLSWRLADLAANYSAQGKWLEAEPLVIRSLELTSKEHGESSWQATEPMLALAEIYRATGRSEKANAIQERVDAIRDPEPSTFEKVKRYTAIGFSLVFVGYLGYFVLSIFFHGAKLAFLRLFRSTPEGACEDSEKGD